MTRSGIGVVICSVAVAVMLGAATRDMTCIPTDAESLYLPAARALTQQPYVSSIHQVEGGAPFLYGKEAAIFLFSLMQRFLNDVQHMWPLTLVCVIAAGLSAILIFFIARRYWGLRAGLLVYGIFVTSFWPYVYVLMIKHQPVSLCFFLLAVFLVQCSGRGAAGVLMLLCSSAAMAAALFSSTASALFIPLYGVAVFYQGIVVSRWGSLRGWAVRIAAGIVGLGLVLIWLTVPDVTGNLLKYWQGYATYVHMNSTTSWFYYYQDVLREWLANPESARGGWLWVWRYFWVVMPVVFPVYLLCVSWILWRAVYDRSFCQRRLEAGGMILLSALPVILAEAKGVTQYGANYYFSFIGFLVLFGYAASVVRWPSLASMSRREKGLIGVLIVAGVVHLLVNAHVFFRDVWPTRMTALTLSRELKSRGISELSVYYNNYMTQKIWGQLREDVKKGLSWQYIDNVYQAKVGYILVPPLVASSVYVGMMTPNADFDEDVYLNGLLRQEKLEKYAAFSLDSMATSRIWRHETDIASYRDLILGQFGEDYGRKSRVWVLDAVKLTADRDKNKPDPDDMFLVERGLRNIGTIGTDYRYKGIFVGADSPSAFEKFTVRLVKAGDPHDGLTAYLYQRQELWNGAAFMPVEGGVSKEVKAGEIATDPDGTRVTFLFKPGLKLVKGTYHLLIYRTGRASDKDFYRVFVDKDEAARYMRVIDGARP